MALYELLLFGLSVLLLYASSTTLAFAVSGSAVLNLSPQTLFCFFVVVVPAGAIRCVYFESSRVLVLVVDRNWGTRGTYLWLSRSLSTLALLLLALPATSTTLTTAALMPPQTGKGEGGVKVVKLILADTKQIHICSAKVLPASPFLTVLHGHVLGQCT